MHKLIKVVTWEAKSGNRWMEDREKRKLFLYTLLTNVNVVSVFLNGAELPRDTSPCVTELHRGLEIFVSHLASQPRPQTLIPGQMHPRLPNHSPINT